MHFTVEAHKIIRRFLHPGDIAVDATAGNGFDTLLLAECVGPSGCVYAIDIQERAIETVSEKLRANGMLNHTRLILGSHANLRQHLAPEHLGRVKVIVFNLGYLPLGDKTLVTQPESTLAGLEQAKEVLDAGGLLSILVYIGHPGGAEESEAVRTWIEVQQNDFQIDRLVDTINPQSPILWTLCKLAVS